VFFLRLVSCVVTVVVSCREILFLLAVSNFTTALVILV